MKLFLFFLAICLLGGCAGSVEKKSSDLTIVLFNGDGEEVEVEYCGKVIMNLRTVKLDYNNVAAVEKVLRSDGRSVLLVKRNGIQVGRFLISSKQIGVVYLFLTEGGSVILRDGNKMPPVI